MDSLGRLNMDAGSNANFKPTMKVDVYDNIAMMMGQTDSVKIGQVLSDGEHGKLNILNPRFKDQLMSLFAEPKPVRVAPGITLPDGHTSDPESKLLQPFKEETLKYVTQYQLQIHNFSGQVNRIA
jgi:hypothetical protein